MEGRQAVRELLLAGRRKVHEVLVAEGAERDGGLAELVDLARDQRVPVREVGRRGLEQAARTEAPQGVVARAAPLRPALVEDLLAGPAPAFLLAVNGVTDPGNLGALLRSAEAAGVSGVVLPRHRAAHVTPTVAKAAAGAVEHLPMAVAPGLPGALADLRGHGVWVVGLDAGARQSLFDLHLADEPVALVLGGEGTGLSRLVRQRCDLLVAIPLAGAISSLNVSVAGALACFEVARRRRR